MSATISGRNVNRIWTAALPYLYSHGSVEETRNGPALVVPRPVMTLYRRPWERVLFSPARDANPFFHLAESMWMLTGSRDATWLDRWVGNFSSRYAEDDGHMHGAYGHRWRRHFPSGEQTPELTGTVDQLSVAARMLQSDPTTRRAVLQMWDPTIDLGADKRDLPCNTTVYLRAHQQPTGWHLVGTILCRSNDIVWGAYGANSVHMSVMLEYVAVRAGMWLGEMWQLSNNWHGYVSELEKIRRRMAHPEHALLMDEDADLYVRHEVGSHPLFLTDTVDAVETELQAWTGDPVATQRNTNPQLLDGLLVPMSRAYARHREGRYDLALEELEDVQHSDWRRGFADWLGRRQAGRAARAGGDDE